MGGGAYFNVDTKGAALIRGWHLFESQRFKRKYGNYISLHKSYFTSFYHAKKHIIKTININVVGKNA